MEHHNNATLRAHGISMDPNMLRLKAKVLKAAELHYGGGCKMMPMGGKWNMRGLKFLRPATIKDKYGIQWAQSKEQLCFFQCQKSLQKRSL